MNNKKVLILVVGLLVALVGLTGCNSDNELLQEAKSAQKEEITMLDLENIASLAGTTSKQFNSSVSTQAVGDILVSEIFNINSEIQITNPLAVEHLDSYNWEFEILDWESGCKYKVYNEDGYVRTKYDKVLSLFPQDAGDTSSVYVKVYGPNNDWQLEIRAKDNLSNNFAAGQCTDGVAIIKNPQTANQGFGQAKLPWGGDAKEWYDNAASAGFRANSFTSFSDIPIGAILVFDEDFVSNHNKGHVVVLVNKNPLQIISMNDITGNKEFDLRPLLNSNGEYDYPHSSRIRYPLGWIEYKLDKTSLPSGYLLNEIAY